MLNQHVDPSSGRWTANYANIRTSLNESRIPLVDTSPGRSSNASQKRRTSDNDMVVAAPLSIAISKRGQEKHTQRQEETTHSKKDGSCVDSRSVAFDRTCCMIFPKSSPRSVTGYLVTAQPAAESLSPQFPEGEDV